MVRRITGEEGKDQGQELQKRLINLVEEEERRETGDDHSVVEDLELQSPGDELPKDGSDGEDHCLALVKLVLPTE